MQGTAVRPNPSTTLCQSLANWHSTPRSLESLDIPPQRHCLPQLTIKATLRLNSNTHITRGETNKQTHSGSQTESCSHLRHLVCASLTLSHVLVCCARTTTLQKQTVLDVCVCVYMRVWSFIQGIDTFVVGVDVGTLIDRSDGDERTHCVVRNTKGRGQYREGNVID